MRANFSLALLLAILASGPPMLWAQAQVTIRVNAAQPLRPFKPIYTYFGYDEPNYTYTANGSKLIHELADQYLPDPPIKDAPGGPRIACGVIVNE